MYLFYFSSFDNRVTNVRKKHYYIHNAKANNWKVYFLDLPPSYKYNIGTKKLNPPLL